MFFPKRFLPLLFCLALTAASCGGGRTARVQREALTPAEGRFPYPEPPAVVSSQEQRVEYAATHFWNKYFERPEGCAPEVVEQAFANYLTLLEAIPLPAMERAQDTLLALAERSQARPDTAGRMLERILSLEEKYLYDVNSPFRNEEFYLPVMRFALQRDDVRDEVRARMERELPLFSLNRPGTVAADFTYTLRNGRTGTLHALRAEYILLFFSNPGCHNCKEIIEALSDSPAVQAHLADGTLQILNVYPDEDLSEWFAYLSHYPRNWINAFDAEGVIRSDSRYYLRAIPSLYLLDADKRVLCKDAPVERVLALLSQY